MKKYERRPGIGRPGSRKLFQELRFATINVDILTGHVSELIDLLNWRRIEIECVQETLERTKFLSSGKHLQTYILRNNNEDKGVTINLIDRLPSRVIEIQCISDRIIVIRIDANCGILLVVGAYVPQTNCPEDEKEELLEKLEDLFRSDAPENTTPR